MLVQYWSCGYEVIDDDAKGNNEKSNDSIVGYARQCSLWQK